MTHSNQSDAFEGFSHLHLQAAPLVLINVWDAASAVIVQSQGALAIATSSASLAWSLGYPDGNHLPKAELLTAVARILRVINTPLSVDIEAGYSDDPAAVAELARQLHDMGVTGINIEDGANSPELMVEKIKCIKSAAPTLFVNARTDVYLASLVEEAQQLSETRRRLVSYQDAGADCLFVPGLQDIEIAGQLKQICNLPLNLMAMTAANIESYQRAGINRISVGPGSFLQAYQTLIQEPDNQNTESTLSYAGLNQLLFVE